MSSIKISINRGSFHFEAVPLSVVCGLGRIGKQALKDRVGGVAKAKSIIILKSVYEGGGGQGLITLMHPKNESVDL